MKKQKITKQKLKQNNEIVEQLPPIKSKSLFLDKIKVYFLEKKLKKLEEQNKEKIKDFSLTQPKSLFDIKKQVNKAKLEHKKKKHLLIHMQLVDGRVRNFIIETFNDSFAFQNKRYIIDDDCLYFNIDSKIWCSNYYEGCAVPYKVKFPINEVNKRLEESAEDLYLKLIKHNDENIRNFAETIGKADIINAINPENLERFIVSKVIEKVIKGSEMEDIFQFLKIMSIVMVSLAGITLLIVIIIAFMV